MFFRFGSDVVFRWIRHPNSTYLEKLASKTENICEGMSDICELGVLRRQTIAFDDNVINEIEVQRVGCFTKKMLSAAGHDARRVLLLPTGMIFAMRKGIVIMKRRMRRLAIWVGAKVLTDVRWSR